MQMTSMQVYDSLINGAIKVIQNKEILNRINIFPVQDGDTGSNLASMMRTIIQKSEPKITVKKTLESVADAALYGARGNSGIIFAQYLRGLSESIEGGELISIHDYAMASNCAAKYAYDAVDEPVEGTMITIMREWGNVLSDESFKKTSITDIFSCAFHKIEIALDKTKEQLPVLKKAGVVDSGAKGFTYFLEGVLYYFKNGENYDFKMLSIEKENYPELMQEKSHRCLEGYRYCTECLLEGNNSIDKEAIKIRLGQMGNSTVVAGNKNKCRIHIHTNEPAVVFNYLQDKGSIIFQKVDDMYKQEAVVNARKSNIALVTDSIADIPQTLIDEYQIHIVPLEILFHDVTYLDRLTISPSRLLKITANASNLPTSSQPSPKQIENLLDYLSTYYHSVIVMTVSKELSGTYNNFLSSAKNFKGKDFKINVINTKQNAGAQGLLVKKCAEYIEAGFTQDEIVKQMEEWIKLSKILVQVRTLDHMIKSGRLSVKAGNIAKRLGAKPIVTLDHNGKGVLDSIAFSINGSDKQITRHIRKILRTKEIEQYNIVHVNNESGAKKLASRMADMIGFRPVYITETSSIIAVSAGEGAIAISYLVKKEVS